MEHSEIILKIIEDRGITPYRMAKDTGISNSLFTEWKRKPTSKIYSGTRGSFATSGKVTKTPLRGDAPKNPSTEVRQ